MEPHNDGLDRGLLLGGFLLGLIVGALIGLFRGPRLNQELLHQISESSEQIRGKLDSVIPTDPVTQSLTEGKTAARQRRAELGLSR
jgi:gas vesicle protein